MMVIAFLILALFSAVLLGAFVTTTRVTARQQRTNNRSIDQDLVEARLLRIEEAIDAMALQIERLTEHQRALLGSREPALPPQDDYRTERPR